MILFDESTDFVPVIDGNTITDEAGKVYDLTRTVPDVAVALVMLGIIMGLSLSIVLLVKFIKKNGAHFLSVFTGVMTFFLFGVFICLIFYRLINSIPTMSQFGVDHPVQKQMILGTILAIMLIAGRFVGMKLVMTKYDTPSDVLAMSTGFALCDVIYSVFSWVILLTVMLTINNEGGIVNLYKDMDASKLLNLAKNYEELFNTPKDAWMFDTLSVILALEFGTYCIIPLYGVYIKKLNPSYIALVAAIYYALIVLNAVAKNEALPYMVVFVIELIIVFASLRYFFMLSKEKLGDMLKPVSKPVVKNNNKKQKSFPKFK